MDQYYINYRRLVMPGIFALAVFCVTVVVSIFLLLIVIGTSMNVSEWTLKKHMQEYHHIEEQIE